MKIGGLWSEGCDDIAAQVSLSLVMHHCFCLLTPPLHQIPTDARLSNGTPLSQITLSRAHNLVTHTTLSFTQHCCDSLRHPAQYSIHTFPYTVFFGYWSVFHRLFCFLDFPISFSHLFRTCFDMCFFPGLLIVVVFFLNSGSSSELKSLHCTRAELLHH